MSDETTTEARLIAAWRERDAALTRAASARTWREVADARAKEMEARALSAEADRDRLQRELEEIREAAGAVVAAARTYEAEHNRAANPPIAYDPDALRRGYALARSGLASATARLDRLLSTPGGGG